MNYQVETPEGSRAFLTLAGAKKAKAEAEKRGQKATIYQNAKKA